ncbi:uncharacterized protein BYT42DRAFT_546905 [Radiomyces spectabilis]|uniref:uncharacterized protein n=1 Tax=Radiomyces spectabilis TaxID=64574 RepID=UPI00221EE19F|nr:uncharacterized protein BYT42DRAFT_546905 [Radiomyces spectabilis]KAI8376198.1 hypothetical protein BYT42DRAFT_546905 [Radiomyces spectabilis]
MPPKRRRIQDEDIPLPQTIVPISSVEEARQALSNASTSFILNSIRTLAIKYNEKHDDDFWDDVERYEAALETLLADFQQRNHLPRGMLQGIEDRAGVRRGSFHSKYQKFDFINIWRNALDQFLELSVQARQSVAASSFAGSSTAESSAAATSSRPQVLEEQI